MSGSQPLICTSLHLPPDPQPFLHICEISGHVFLSNLDRLRLALEATRKINPEAVEIFFEARKVLWFKLTHVLRVLLLGKFLAEHYLSVLEALAQRQPTQLLLDEVYGSAIMGMRHLEDGQKSLSVFQKELEDVVCQVTCLTVGVEDKKGSELYFSFTSAPENLQLLLEVLCGIDECKRSLQQCHSQFAKLKARIRDRDCIDANPPSKEEIGVIWEKWKTYFDAMKSAWHHGSEIACEIACPSSELRRDASESRKPRQKPFPSWRANFKHPKKQHSVHSAYILEVLSECTDPDAAVNATEASENTHKMRVPFWRKIFRRTNNNLIPPQDASGKLQANDCTPDIRGLPPKATFWRLRHLSRCTFRRHYFDTSRVQIH